MNFNTFGRVFSFTSFGESHGPAMGCVVDGCPARVPLCAGDIQPMLDRRRPGTGRHVSLRQEPDEVRILSGVYEGMTTGHPICLIIENRDQRPTDYAGISRFFRPGHADGVYETKYGIRDPRGGGRSSARETIARVAAAAVARKALAQFPETAGIGIVAGLTKLGVIAADPANWNDDAIDGNAVFCPDAKAATAMLDGLADVRERGDSLGGVVEIRARNVPPGLGEPVYDRLDARIAQACMGLNAVKGVEIGDGFAVACASGSGNNDAMRHPESGKFGDAFVTNHAGGVLGGISSGQEIVVRCAIKPTPSISLGQRSVDGKLNDIDVEISGRHDPAVAVRAVPVLEAMMWLVLTDFFLLHRARRNT